MAAGGVDLGGGGEIEESGDQSDHHATIFNSGGRNDEVTAALHHQAHVSDAKSSEVDKDHGVNSSSTSTCVAVEVQIAGMNKAAVTAKASALAEAAQFTAVNSFTARATTSEQTEPMATIADLEAKIADLSEAALFAAVDAFDTASAIISEQSELLARIADLEKLEETINGLGKTYASIANLHATIRDLQRLRVTIADLEAGIAVIENVRIAILPNLDAKFDDDLRNLKLRIRIAGASIDDLEAKITAIQVKLKEATESRAKIGNQKKGYNNIAGEPWAVTAVVALLSAVSAFAAYYLRAKRRIGK